MKSIDFHISLSKDVLVYSSLSELFTKLIVQRVNVTALCGSDPSNTFEFASFNASLFFNMLLVVIVIHCTSTSKIMYLM